MKRTIVALAAIGALGALGAGCSGAATDPPATDVPAATATTEAPGTTDPEETQEPEEPEEPARTVIDITVEDLEFDPSGERLEVPLGQEVELNITADAPGELHVHSSPEQFIEYAGNGRPETFTFTIDRPGQVEVESHDNGTLIVNLVVS